MHEGIEIVEWLSSNAPHSSSRWDCNKRGFNKWKSNDRQEWRRHAPQAAITAKTKAFLKSLNQDAELTTVVRAFDGLKTMVASHFWFAIAIRRCSALFRGLSKIFVA